MYASVTSPVAQPSPRSPWRPARGLQQLESTSSSSSSGASGGTIKIGVDLPVSGADASIGIPTQNGAVLAVEEANKNGFAGGKFKLEASLLDDAVQGKHDPNAGAQNVKTFIADDAVLAMIGPFNSNVAQAEIPLTNDAGLAQISPSNTNDGLTVGDNAKKLRTAHPDTNAYFRVCTRDTKQGQTLAQVAAQRLNFKKAFIIDDNETYGKGLADVFDAQYRQLGGTVLGHEHITANQTDFKALLTKIKAQNPDVVFFGGNTSTGGGLDSPPDGRRRAWRRRRTSAATGSRTTSSRRRPATWRTART